MKTIFDAGWFVLFTALLFTAPALAQSTQNATPTSKKRVHVKGLFEKEDLLDITLSGNFRLLLNDRSDNPALYPLVLTYQNEDSVEIAISIKATTRGRFRKMKENCEYPPLLLQFSHSDTLKSSIFKEQKKLKLVMPCQGDEYVVREWIAYKIYNLLTPQSFKARLTRVTLADAKTKKTKASFYGILLEEEKQMAKRNGMVPLSKKMRPEQLNTDAFLTMAVFEYLIANTDWSVQYRQNVKLIATDSNAIPVPVPYDFDHAGLVDAPYAKPAEALRMNSVRERRFRCYCISNLNIYDSTIARFNKLKNDFYKIFTDCPYLDPKYVKSTLKYFDQFYETINNPALLKRAFMYPCDPNGTGNVVIKGYQEE